MTHAAGAEVQAADTAIRSRDADRTRELLLKAARHRFARNGYAATTVREIASDAGVNVALINRYFASKEGLFEACLDRAVREIDRTDDRQLSFEGLLRNIVWQVSDDPSGENQLQLLLLLRSSGDESADQLRRNTVHSYAERIAAIAGWRRDDPATAALLLRAQVTLATAFGIVLLRASTGLEPLTSATRDDLAEPLSEVFSTLLMPRRGEAGGVGRE